MKKTIQINIGGLHFHMDEDAFHKLNHYLESLKSHFSAEGDTGKEIMEDIEQRIAELLEKKITVENQAVSLDDVNEAIGILGKVEDFVYEGTSGQTHDQYERRDNRRFYRDEDSNYIAGVAAGLGAYFDIDPLWVRLAFLGLAFLHGLGVLIYIILWIVVPKATTTVEKLQMRGMPVTLSTIKESVTAEYDKVKAGLNNFGNSGTAHKARNAFESLIRAIGLVIVAIFKFVIGAIGIFILVLGSIFLVAFIVIMAGFTGWFGHFQIWNGIAFPHISHLFANSGHYYLMVICLLILVLIPIIALIYGGIKIIFNIRTRNNVLRAFTLTAWILALVLFITLVIVNSSSFAMEATSRKTIPIEIKVYPRIYVDVRDNTNNQKITQYSVFDYHFNYSDWDKSLYTTPSVSIVRSDDQGMYLSVEKRANHVVLDHSQDYFDRIRYNWEQKDSVIYIDRYLTTDEKDFWMFGRITLDLRVPENQVVVLSSRLCDLLNYDQQERYCNDSLLAGRPSIMTPNGLMLSEKQKTIHNRKK